MLRLSPHAVERLEISVESLCMDCALFISDNATEINSVQEQEMLEMMQGREDQKITSARNADIAKHRQNPPGARVFRVEFEVLSLQRIGI
jgi:hypothetical protein